METSTIWKKFHEPLRNFVLSKVKDESVANDIVQEVFIKIHLHQAELKNKKALKSWIFSIAHNLIIDSFKKDFRVVDITELPASQESQEQHSPQNCLLPLIEKLPENYRETLLLSEIEGKKQAEVAELLKISLSGAKSRIQRGRKLLQQGFMECCDYKITKNGFLVGEHKSAEECKVCN